MANAEAVTKTEVTITAIKLTLTPEEAAIVRALTGNCIGDRGVYNIYHALRDAGVEYDHLRLTRRSLNTTDTVVEVRIER